MNNCGGRFHSEMAKFRFLNELIKVLSPKVGDGGYRVFWDKECTLFYERQWDLLAVPLFMGVGCACQKHPLSITPSISLSVAPAHIHHWCTFHFPLHQPKGRAANADFKEMLN